MNLSNTNSGGWANSYMRTVICQQFYSAVNSTWREAMKPVIKYTDNVGGATNSYENVTGTEDYIFLMSEFEIFGSRSYANSYEKSFQQRYDYYAINNIASARIRVADMAVSSASISAGAAVHWWERSPDKNPQYVTGHRYRIVVERIDPNGGCQYAIESYGFVPNFVMVAA